MNQTDTLTCPYTNPSTVPTRVRGTCVDIKSSSQESIRAVSAPLPPVAVGYVVPVLKLTAPGYPES